MENSIPNIIGFSKHKSALESDGYHWASTPEVDETLQLAHNAWLRYRNYSGAQKADFLRAIADGIEALGDELIQTVMQESHLPQGRVVGERGRTCHQLRLFAQLVAEGSWVEATIDHADRNRTPAPKPDIRKVLQALGPVVVFTASNFPLAFSTAGGDTAAALAAGCPVIIKAHEAHLKTNALVAGAIQKAAQDTDMPDGVFSSLQGKGHEIGQQLVLHPHTQAVAFTGSFGGGQALYDLVRKRQQPIPVFAEMGSINPVFFLPETLAADADTWAVHFANSLCMGVGQFCTNPGLMIMLDDAASERFRAMMTDKLAEKPADLMLHAGILKNYQEKKENLLSHRGVHTEYTAADTGKGAAIGLASVSASEFLADTALQEEVFGPFGLIVLCKDVDEIWQVANSLQGQLTATLIGNPLELSNHEALIDLLQTKVGRLIFNGVPTGVEVGYAMQHGGPYPATTDARFSSVGTSAIKRFARPVAFQDCPPALLPPALREDNPLHIWRMIDGEWQKK